MPKGNNVIDLDAIIRAKQEAAAAEIPVITIRLFDRDWRIYADLNSYTALGFDGGDPSAMRQFIDNLVHEDEREEFQRVVSGQRGITPEILGDIVRGFVEAAAERPTKSPSASAGGASKRTSSPKSTAARRSTAASRSIR
jgi:hypothetical protein